MYANDAKKKFAVFASFCIVCISLFVISMDRRLA